MMTVARYFVFVVALAIFNGCAAQDTGQKEVGKEVPFDTESLEEAIRTGRWDHARQLILKAHEQDYDVTSAVRAATSKVKQYADELIRLLDKKHDEISTISPAFQWAQSVDSVFLQIKFGYRWSSPGALSVENEAVTVTANSFEFIGVGSHSFSKTKYHLKLDLFEEVLAEASDWSFGSVGKLVVTLKKSKASNWKRLSKSKDKIPNGSVWWEMKEKYQHELDKLDRPGHTPASRTEEDERGEEPSNKTPYAVDKVPEPNTEADDSDAKKREGKGAQASDSVVNDSPDFNQASKIGHSEL